MHVLNDVVTDFYGIAFANQNIISKKYGLGFLVFVGKMQFIQGRGSTLETIGLQGSIMTEPCCELSRANCSLHHTARIPIHLLPASSQAYHCYDSFISTHPAVLVVIQSLSKMTTSAVPPAARLALYIFSLYQSFMFSSIMANAESRPGCTF